MDTRWLIDNGIVWKATEEVPSYQSAQKVNPESILSQGFSHEFFVEAANSRQITWPVCALLPFINILNEQKERTTKQDSYVVFLGKEVWPTPFILRDVFFRHFSLANFLYINPLSQKTRQRALEVLSNSSNVLAVVTSLPKVSFAFTQKIHLFSKRSQTYTFVFRDSRDLCEKTAAHSRWLLSPCISKTDFPSWNITLQHSKGSCLKEKEWRMEGLNEKEVFVHLLSDLVDRPDTAEVASTRCA